MSFKAELFNVALHYGSDVYSIACIGRLRVPLNINWVPARTLIHILGLEYNRCCANCAERYSCWWKFIKTRMPGSTTNKNRDLRDSSSPDRHMDWRLFVRNIAIKFWKKLFWNIYSRQKVIRNGLKMSSLTVLTYAACGGTVIWLRLCGVEKQATCNLWSTQAPPGDYIGNTCSKRAAHVSGADHRVHWRDDTRRRMTRVAITVFHTRQNSYTEFTCLVWRAPANC